jgi:hypothetical protein
LQVHEKFAGDVITSLFTRACTCVTLVWFCRRRRDGAFVATSHLLMLKQHLGLEVSQQTHSKPASAPQLKISTLTSLSCAA